MPRLPHQHSTPIAVFLLTESPYRRPIRLCYCWRHPHYRPHRPRLTVGFAAETDNVTANAAAKRAAKNADWIVANDVRPETGIMGGTSNRIHLFTASGQEDWPELPKDEVARRLAAKLAAAMPAAISAALVGTEA